MPKNKAPERLNKSFETAGDVPGYIYAYPKEAQDVMLLGLQSLREIRAMRQQQSGGPK